MLAHLLGLDDASGAWYLFWSGFGADLVYLGALATALRKINCQTHGCWRVGRHLNPDTGAHMCRRHHG